MRWLVPFVLVVSTLAGCGGDGDGYIDRMEAACDVRDLSIEALVQPIPEEFSPEYIDHVVRGSVEVIGTYLEEVRAIGSPGGDLEDEHDRYVALLEETLERYEAAVGDEARSAEVFNLPAPEFFPLERKLGLPTCGTAGNGLEPEPDR